MFFYVYILSFFYWSKEMFVYFSCMQPSDEGFWGVDPCSEKVFILSLLRDHRFRPFGSLMKAKDSSSEKYTQEYKHEGIFLCFWWYWKLNPGPSRWIAKLPRLHLNFWSSAQPPWVLRLYTQVFALCHLKCRGMCYLLRDIVWVPLSALFLFQN